MTDFTIRNEGTIALLQPLTAAASVWTDEHIPDDAMTWGSAIVIEHRYVDSIVTGIIEDGLSIAALT